MPCLKIPTPQIPPLSGAVTIALPDIPIPSFEIGICCKLPIPPIPIPPIVIPKVTLSAVFTPPVIATLNGYIKTAVDYINSIPGKCPLE